MSAGAATLVYCKACQKTHAAEPGEVPCEAGAWVYANSMIAVAVDDAGRFAPVPLARPLELTPEEWRTIRHALSVHHKKIKGQIKRAMNKATTGPHSARPSELAMQAADVFTVWKKLKDAGAGGP